MSDVKAELRQKLDARRKENSKANRLIEEEAVRRFTVCEAHHKFSRAFLDLREESGRAWFNDRAPDARPFVGKAVSAFAAYCKSLRAAGLSDAIEKAKPFLLVACERVHKRHPEAKDESIYQLSASLAFDLLSRGLASRAASRTSRQELTEIFSDREQWVTLNILDWLCRTITEGDLSRMAENVAAIHQPAHLSHNASERQRACYHRDHFWLKWSEDKTDDTYRRPARIRDKWNRMPEAQRKTLSPRAYQAIPGGRSGADRVRKGIEMARNEREEETLL
jgi:hypothetical protein